LWRPTAIAALLAVALRVPSVGVLAHPDEGGLLLVARQWHHGGSGLYGHLWVDRPPLLVLFWKLGDLLGGVVAARLSALAAVAALVVVASWVGRLLGGDRAAAWSAFVAAGLACSPLLGGGAADAELLAAPLVLLACGSVLKAGSPATGARAQAGWAAMSGLAGAAAALLKQNLMDGLVFAAVLVAVSGLTRAWSRARTVRVLGFGTLGVAVPAAATLVWASVSGVGIDTLAYTLYGFRLDAAKVVATSDAGAPESRLLLLVGVALLSGLALLFAVYLWSTRRRLLSRDPTTVATTAMSAFGLLAVVAGASFWTHYLIELLPAAVLATGALAGLPRPSRPARVAMAAPVLSGVITAVVLATPFVSSRQDEAGLVSWLERVGRPGDTALVTYGHADIVEASGLAASSYPYLWSLPLRTRDPHLRLLVRNLSRPSRPTWLVEWNSFDSWGLDARGRMAAAVRRYYGDLGTVCGVEVFLRKDVQRPTSGGTESC
jgi:hypothetical protein